MTKPIDIALEKRQEERFLNDLFDELFPICRSITGPGLRESMEIIGRFLPLEIESVPSGERVLDWVVPREWRIRGARLIGPDGKTYADFDRHNLHVVNYSKPVDGEFDLEELKPHLHSLDWLPDAIPYVFSYYDENWGFCLPHRVFKELPQGRYRCVIDSEFLEGEVSFAQCVLEGETDQEIQLSSYLCHPSMANNELSGPLVLVALYNRISRWKRRRYTYRFVLNPETIGSICYLARYGDRIRERLVAGLVLTCLGGPRKNLSYKLSRRGDSLIDRTVRWLKAHDEMPLEIRPFTPTNGSDERQYCSPGFNLPVGQIARTVYGTYDEYHTSLDTKEFMGISSLVKSADEIERLLIGAESSGYFMNLEPHGEPQLSKRNLYHSINSPKDWGGPDNAATDDRSFLDRVLYVLNYSDGHYDMLDIADMCGCTVSDLVPVIEELENAKLLRLKRRADPAL